MNQRRNIADALAEFEALRAGEEMPSPACTEAIGARLARSLTPVRPFPSDALLMLGALAGFVCFSIVAGVLVGLAGFHHLSSVQKLIYYLAIVLAAALLSLFAAKEAIPGSHRRIASGLAIALSFCTLALVSFALFPEPDFAHFAQRGLPCLKLGLLCAALSGSLAALLLRRGFVTSPIRAAVTFGSVSGLTGFAVLALHCPLQNIAHIGVWHLGAMLLAAGAGGVLGFLSPLLQAQTPTRA